MTNTSQRRALVVQSNTPFGNKLIQSGYINPEQLQQAIKTARPGQPLTEILESITGQPLPPELARQYKKQQLFELRIVHGVEAYDPEIEPMTTEELEVMLKFLETSLETCKRHRFIPLRTVESDPSSVLIAMVDPDNLTALEELRNQILRPKALKLQRRVITHEDYDQIISAYSNEDVKRKAVEAAIREKEKLEFTAGDFDTTDLEDVGDEGGGMDLADEIQESETAPVIKAVNVILAKALSEGVSDIHVEPQEHEMRIRMRRDGVLEEYYKFPKKVIPAITSRFKILAEMDIAERRQAQDGRIRRKFRGRTVDFRVNSLPSRYGEKIVLRILDSSSTQLGLDKLITDQETLALVRETASRPFGLILVTGPTGSGKSTSLYSVLAERNDPAINISTAEDPIEYALPGITQCQVIREKNLTFANILRAFLRQDPDVLLVGETRDLETAKTSIEAALTGHLVLTTLHTNDAAGAIARLDEMGVEPFMVSAALLGILAQRLMRRVCGECRVPYTPTSEELGRYGLSTSQEVDITFYKANTIPIEQRKHLTDGGQLCKKCNGLGYKGRVGVYEFLKVTERLQTLITKGAPTEQIKEAAVEEGMKTILAYSLQLVREGYTTFEEVERVTFTDSGLEAELKAKRKQGLTCKSCEAELKPEWLDCPYCMTPRFTS
ncbi:MULTISPECIES: GspE/PulE family protein [Planktothrix]|jgi:type IV pilus assembly protein PilB|uniref:General secretion pathway protein E n=2 Tax=Planktothrix TaxID=54304 RepID=A0A6J7ZF14_PLARU|nr:MULTISPECIES: GspE/PulE family protein [Planktothrix]CAD5975267.1 Type IV pilus assembly protein PilF [Planktothrix rubescens]CAC5339911.1 General secretion pathway protein E [Planktothrix rubescens NIVA-CYA 18]CAD5969819.1 Type IV pilus assembly protein PilF [Planktothrix rubescens NIVA-CYA 18]CAD5976004.1 Type IV pilus assembly protein PilF [Planktothrix agardhii]CAH2574198.1 Type IV pilus assembly protein PilF [Planktothrix rubescens]